MVAVTMVEELREHGVCESLVVVVSMQRDVVL